MTEAELREIEARAEKTPELLAHLYDFREGDESLNCSWINPWSGNREVVVGLYWPGHPIEKTEWVEGIFEALTQFIARARLDVRELLASHRALSEKLRVAVEEIALLKRQCASPECDGDCVDCNRQGEQCVTCSVRASKGSKS